MKVPYLVLTIEVDKMYPPHYVIKPDETIEQHLKDIETFIEACGWDVSEYIAEYVHQGIKEFFPDHSEMN